MITRSGHTRLAAVIGDPIRHSLSPTIFNAAFDEVGLDWVYLAFEVAEPDTAAALDAARVLGIEGLSVTMPHKTAVARLVDELTPSARTLDAVNCVVRDGRRLVGHNTDGAGFVASLAADAGFDPAGRACVVLGAGGAARAVVLALSEAGAGQVSVVNRTADRAESTASLAGTVGRVGVAGDARRADLVVNATSVGMGGDGCPIDPDLLGPGQLVADLVYHPVTTPLLEAAQARGAATLDGVGMLVHQGAVAFGLWTGRPAPVAAMGTAARAALVTAR
jgi:shikimate dehydrogenase